MLNQHADKVRAIVIWPIDNIHEASKQLALILSNYKHIPVAILNLFTNIHLFVVDKHKLGHFNYTTYKFLIPPTPAKISTFYLLPKIDKAGL